MIFHFPPSSLRVQFIPLPPVILNTRCELNLPPMCGDIPGVKTVFSNQARRTVNVRVQFLQTLRTVGPIQQWAKTTTFEQC